MSDEKNTEEYKRISKNQKVEDFDFYELTADLSNSITDQLYRDYLPILEKKYREDQKKFGDTNIQNDLEVEGIVKSIKEKINEKIAEKTSEQIADQLLIEFNEQYHAEAGSLEDKADSYIKRMRWLLMPAFMLSAAVILSIALVVLAQVYYLVGHVFDVYGVAFVGEGKMKESINFVVADVLSILDLLLLGALVVMVVVGGYENSISRIGMSHNVPTWFGKLDIGSLKIKVAASIVIISSIHLLMSFMNIDNGPLDKDKIMWTAIIHIVFVVSALVLAYVDRVTKKKNI